MVTSMLYKSIKQEKIVQERVNDTHLNSHSIFVFKHFLMLIYSKYVIFIIGAYTQKSIQLPVARIYHQSFKSSSFKRLNWSSNTFASIDIFLSLSFLMKATNRCTASSSVCWEKFPLLQLSDFSGVGLSTSRWCQHTVQVHAFSSSIKWLQTAPREA